MKADTVRRKCYTPSQCIFLIHERKKRYIVVVVVVLKRPYSLLNMECFLENRGGRNLSIFNARKAVWYQLKHSRTKRRGELVSSWVPRVSSAYSPTSQVHVFRENIQGRAIAQYRKHNTVRRRIGKARESLGLNRLFSFLLGFIILYRSRSVRSMGEA